MVQDIKEDGGTDGYALEEAQSKDENLKKSTETK
jgi:hypothetical protein